MESDSTDFYATLADYYEALFPAAPETAHFLVRQLRRTDGTILDVGCGTGGHVRQMLDQGGDAWGTDLSSRMIEIARELDPEHEERYSVDSMLNAHCHAAAPVDLLVCIGNSLSHLSDRTAVRSFIGTVRDAVTPGGRAVIQIVEMESIRKGASRELPTLHAFVSEQQSAVLLRRTYHRESDDRMLFDAVLEHQTESGPVEAHVQQKLLVLSPTVLADQLRSAGFQSVRILAGYSEELRLLDDTSWVRVLVAE
jgi:SAM-dependent methyltransferase